MKFQGLRHASPGHWLRVGAAFIFMSACQYLMSVAQIYSDTRTPHVTVCAERLTNGTIGVRRVHHTAGGCNGTLWSETPVLPDLGFDVIPDSTFLPKHLADYWVFGFMLLTALRMLAAKQCTTAFRRFFFVQGIMFLFRSITISVTSLPNPDPFCHRQPHPNVPLDAFEVALGMEETCGDVLFSGHTVTLTLLALTWQAYTDRSAKQLTAAKMAAWVLAFTGFYILLALRFHYTDDVLLGCFCSLCIWNWYHRAVAHCHDAPADFPRCICWFEADAASSTASQSIPFQTSAGFHDPESQSDALLAAAHWSAEPAGSFYQPLGRPSAASLDEV